MDVVIRPVNDRFLREVAFPVFETGVVDAVAALEGLLDHVQDDRTRILVETVLSRGVEGSFFTLDAYHWLEAAYRLLFWEWLPSLRGGWQISSEYVGFAGVLDETLNLALMIEDNRYPYWDAELSRQARIDFFNRPATNRGLSSFLCGRWDPFPAFPPDQAVMTGGRDPAYDSGEQLAIADWTYRSMETVSGWAASLAPKLASLLRREGDRLRPIAIPETDEIYDFWMGRRERPPMLTVAFSGLGSTAPTWVRDLGALSRLVRDAASLEQGLTSIIAPPGRQATYGDY
jgi:hypothetical protein